MFLSLALKKVRQIKDIDISKDRIFVKYKSFLYWFIYQLDRSQLNRLKSRATYLVAGVCIMMIRGGPYQSAQMCRLIKVATLEKDR